MFWVVQDNLYRERGYDELMLSLQRLGVPHVVTKVAPMTHRLLPADFDSSKYFGDLGDAPEIEVDTSGLVFSCGSVTLSEIAQQRGWEPGSFLNANNDQVVWFKIMSGHCLNDDAIICRFDEVQKQRLMFIRPTLDDKSFPGKTINWSGYKKWLKEVNYDQEVGNEFAPVKTDTLVAVARPKNIEAEYRFFVVDGEIATASQYKKDRQLFSSSIVSPIAEEFCQEMIRIWQPARAFVIDIAVTAFGPKIVEYGCINSAGFYDADISKFVQAIEGMEFSNALRLR